MKRQLIVLAAVVSVLAGCGATNELAAPPVVETGAAAEPDAAETADAADATDATDAAALPDACALLTQADAEKLATTALDPPVKARDTCTWTGPVTGPTAQVEVFVGDGAKKFLDIDRELAHEFTEVAGIGDEAHLEDGAIFFAKGGVWVSVRLVRLVDPKETHAPLEAAARTAVGRM
ncbi:hypothetical protein [Asanoa siamensis]|uniref:DUF3558 domain-containing protein n=1 Tax=Asanoa siamensis TaxID=926357 RepID=A0ABQ4CZ52_9ACTN|nr:hypothetical protein [Asanoa siamensis]GIF76559.1 hypothetical protein Asi02nite_60770 [Asanoa siamensis]